MQLAHGTSKPLFMVFLDLKKAYDTLDRGRTLKILEGYGVGENTRRFIERIWDGDTMIPKQSGYFGKPFRAERGVRQGDIMSPIIFNIICDAVIREWEKQRQSDSVETQYYADDGLLMGHAAQEVQSSLDIMSNLFARFGLKMNAMKTEAMIMAGEKTAPALSEVAYARMTGGNGKTCRDRMDEKVVCEFCTAEVRQGYFQTHMQTRSCLASQKECNYTPAEIEVEPESDDEQEPKVYHTDMPKVSNTRTPCPVNGCTGSANRWHLMRKHFRALHIKDTVVILGEGNSPLPRCGECELFQKNVGKTHTESDECKQHAQVRKNRILSKIQRAAKRITFYVDGVPIKTVREFKYLGRVLSDDDKDQPAVTRNMQRAQSSWFMLSKLLGRGAQDNSQILQSCCAVDFIVRI